MVKCTIYHTQLEMFSFFKNTDVSNKNERKRKTKNNTQDDSDKSSMSCIKNWKQFLIIIAVKFIFSKLFIKRTYILIILNLLKNRQNIRNFLDFYCTPKIKIY